MTKVKFAVVFAVMVCVIGIFSKTAKAEFYFAPNGQSYWRPTLVKPEKETQLDILYNQAIAEGQKGNYQANARLFTEIIRLDPQGAYGYYNRGIVKRVHLNDPSGAIEDFQTAANLFKQQGNESMSQQALRQIQIISPSNNNRTSSSRSRSSIQSLRAQQRQCAAKVKRRYGYGNNNWASIRNAPDYPEILVTLQNECVTPFLSK